MRGKILMIPTRFKGTCHFCKRELNTAESGVFRYTHGWVMNRSGGGANSVSLPERSNHWAHGQCIKRLTDGTYKQGGLFDVPAPPPKEPEPTNASEDESGMLVHVCNICGGTAPYGVGVALRAGDLGLWYCRMHLPPADYGYLE